MSNGIYISLRGGHKKLTFLAPAPSQPQRYTWTLTAVVSAAIANGAVPSETKTNPWDCLKAR